VHLRGFLKPGVKVIRIEDTDITPGLLGSAAGCPFLLAGEASQGDGDEGRVGAVDVTWFVRASPVFLLSFGSRPHACA
jgi:hypothetical protein